MKISNETRVGALTAIAITFLILGYNYMANEGDMFKPKSFYVAVYDQAPGLSKGKKILLNGYKVGFVNSVSYDPKTNKIITVLKITEKLDIPENSVAQLISEDILGSRAIKLILNENSKTILESGDTLRASIETSKLDELSRTVDPVIHKVEGIVGYLDSVIIKTGQLQAAIGKTTDVMTSVERLANTSADFLSANHNNFYQTIENLKNLTAEILAKKEAISGSIDNLGEFTQNLNQSEILSKLETTLANLESISQKIDEGQGSAGKLVNDDALYTQLTATVQEMNKLLIDLNKYPEKYVPMPWGKKQRRKAKELSSKESYNQ